MERKIVINKWKTFYWEKNSEVLDAILLHYRAMQLIMLYQSAFMAEETAKLIKWDPKSMNYRSQLLGIRMLAAMEVDIFQRKLLVKDENHQILQDFDVKGRNISDMVGFLRDMVMYTGNDRYSIKLDITNQLYPLDINDNKEWLNYNNEYPVWLVGILLENANLLMKYVLCTNKITGIPTVDSESMDYLLEIPINYKNGILENAFLIGVSMNPKLNDAPYFFVKLKTNTNTHINSEKLGTLVLGNWEFKSFQGAKLPITLLNRIKDKEKQSNSVLFFFENVMELLKRQLFQYI